MRKKGGSKILQFPYLCYLQNRHNIFEHGTCTGESDPRIELQSPHTKNPSKKRIVILFFYDSTNVVIDISLRLNTQFFYLRLYCARVCTIISQDLNRQATVCPAGI